MNLHKHNHSWTTTETEAAEESFSSHATVSNQEPLHQNIGIQICKSWLSTNSLSLESLTLYLALLLSIIHMDELV